MKDAKIEVQTVAEQDVDDTILTERARDARGPAIRRTCSRR